MFDLLKKKISGVVNSFINKKEEEAIQEPDSTLAKQQQNGPESEEDRKIHQPRDYPVPDRPAFASAGSEGKSQGSLDSKTKSVEAQSPDQQKSKPAVSSNIRLSITTKIKGALLKNVSLNESEINDLAQDIEITMLQSDVAHETAEKFSESLKAKLKSDRFDYKNIRKEINTDMRTALLGVLESAGKSPDIIEMARSSKASGSSSRILFIGPNGTGKTTTIAKVAYLLKRSGFSVAISASDTFRAAAIEQTEHHGKSVGVPVIKSGYGADPASVAYDTIEYARAHRIDVALIDTAGRQETNKNLIMEVQKMVRVSKPDITIFIGESTAGNAISRQISELQKSIKIDCIILTKLDCDAKGGNAISIADITGVPIAFFCNGESYDSIIKYDPNIILDAVIPAS